MAAGSFDLNSPINWILLSTFVCLLLVWLSQPKPYKAPPPKHAEVIELRDYTPIELSEFDGLKSKKIFMGVNGKVYDVTRGASFYGPGGMYGNFAGRDASRGLAKNSFDISMVTAPDQAIDKLEDLEADEWQSLRDWANFFESKYDHVGFLIENKQ
ncbi:cytochrome b5 [Cladochytrium replicatum]|nr:cytochrome b5 [Cladochytrium replicatum]